MRVDGRRENRTFFERPVSYCRLPSAIFDLQMRDAYPRLMVIEMNFRTRNFWLPYNWVQSADTFSRQRFEQLICEKYGIELSTARAPQRPPNRKWNTIIFAAAYPHDGRRSFSELFFFFLFSRLVFVGLQIGRANFYASIILGGERGNDEPNKADMPRVNAFEENVNFLDVECFSLNSIVDSTYEFPL